MRKFLVCTAVMAVAGMFSMFLLTTRPAVSAQNEWQGWSWQAYRLYRYYDEEMGIACYVNTHATYKFFCAQVTK